MKIVKIHGGLGNQMFQHAFALRLDSRWPGETFIDPSAFAREPAHNGFELGRLFSLSLPVAAASDVRGLSVQPRGPISRLRRKYIGKRSHFIDRSFGYQPELLERADDLYFEGYWQSEKYFASIASTVRREFFFNPTLDDENRRILAEVPRPVASIHVRRGDYLRHPNLDICTPAYYGRAIGILREAGIASFLVFSDDIEYCRQTLPLADSRAVFVDRNRGAESWQDMAMMAACDHFVIANSSFSWWAAWLGGGEGKRVLAPSVWNRREIHDSDHYYSYTFADIVPPAWERVAI